MEKMWFNVAVENDKGTTRPAANRRSERDEASRLSRWFPLIQLAGLPVPKTAIYGPLDEASLVALSALRELPAGGVVQPPDACSAICHAAKVAGIEAPCFLRTDHTSAKHEWSGTCFLPVLTPSTVLSHMLGIIQYSEDADMMGLPWTTWVVRELLPTRPLFRAFMGRMPITREFRVFVQLDSGEPAVSHFQPYWPPDSIKHPSPSVPNWCDLLMQASQTTAVERGYLGDLACRAARAAGSLCDYWSVDLLETTRGWYVTDMAEGEKSFWWNSGSRVRAGQATGVKEVNVQ